MSYIHNIVFSRPCGLLNTSEERNIFVAIIPRDLLAFFSLLTHDSHTLVCFLLGLRDALKGRMRSQMLHHPVVKILNIGNGVDDTAWS
jgi:hypothetical protein